MSLSETTVRLLKYDFTEEETKGLADQIMENLKSLSRFEGELKTIEVVEEVAIPNDERQMMIDEIKEVETEVVHEESNEEHS